MKMGTANSISYQVMRCTFIILSILLVFYTIFPLKFHYMISYTKQILTMVHDDSARVEKVQTLTWKMEFKLHKMEMQFNKQYCASNPPRTKKVAWLTAMNNDNFAVGAVHLGYVLRRLSCHADMIVLVGPAVSKAAREAMKAVGFTVNVVEPLDCNWMDRRRGISEQNLGIPGTHTRFHAWNYTQYEKIIYLDADVMPLHNIDELFEMEGDLAATYCARPGLLDPCFNAGLLVFRPSVDAYNGIMDLWKSLSVGKTCPNDQVLLWHHYADQGAWVPLPYAYNVRRQIYHPMKVYHFACCLTKKPWLVSQRPSRDVAANFEGPLVEPQDMVVLWWKYFYRLLDEHQLNSWFESVTR